MANIKSWIKAMRLRTLPLAVSSTLAGSFVAIADRKFDGMIIALAIVTTLMLQILSNLANDLGDSLKGADNKNRVGPSRAVQSGEISVKEMKWGVAITSFITLLSGISLIFAGFGSFSPQVLIFFALGVISIIAALKYTLGKSAYGYRGFGDLFVFIFFGLLGVLGTYYLNAKELNAGVWLMAASVGLLSTGVLNLNNMRDIENDRASGKMTVAVNLGSSRARLYHILLITVGLIAGIAFTFFNYQSPRQFVFIIVIPLFIKDLMAVSRTEIPRQLDPFLKKLALSTFFYILLFGLGIIISI
jgi:1,4-dihydroxy-2-naphthoate polyprenyltransferase